MRSIEISYYVIFGDLLEKEGVTGEQKTKSKAFLAEKM